MDVLVRTEAIGLNNAIKGKALLHRIACMLTKMTQPNIEVREETLQYPDYDFEHEHEKYK